VLHQYINYTKNHIYAGTKCGIFSFIASGAIIAIICMRGSGICDTKLNDSILV